ncbi:sporulation peptidase YabG [Niameybacter massiliensis]|uniref:Sporulation peptidase YabG n=1 Tax=Holtiella tumoricola TaxID=3018743 RepID=A0AA42J2K2_9FIRM|nr:MULTISPECIES: sporulation peptidase YabG [Lachnospirales]MDA3733293.1 sporulation peptidase YabG [Holtiella tumoricola]
MVIAVGDYVVRISYNRDVLFKVLEIRPDGIVKLKGISYRIIADAPIEDLELAGGMRFTNKENDLMEKIQQTVKNLVLEKQLTKDKNKPILQKTGKVLHIDGDTFYLSLCMKYYDILGVNAVGENVLEFEQPKKISSLLQKHNPDILVLTGHDSLNKKYKNLFDINEYKNSKYFVEAIKEARKVPQGNKQLIIFAGACQSFFEALLEAGADYAASPERVLIHALDPVFIVERIAYCPFNEVLSIEEAIKNTVTKFKGVGGYEILGVARKGGPVVGAFDDKS